jgi:diaminopimelate decarboxylase
MSSPTQARKNLAYLDPTAFTPHFGWKKSKTASAREVYCEGVALREIAERYRTPAYVYSSAAIEDALEELRLGFRDLPHLLCFAVKANGNLSILKFLAERGCGFDIVSSGELDYLARIGVPGSRIVFSGVGKTREEIREALRYKSGRTALPGILQFNIESQAELEILLQESGRFNPSSAKPAGASIRVNPDVKAGGHPHISTGLQEHKFGLTWPQARSLYLSHRDSKHIRWQGISAHIGSQIVSLEPFRRALQRLAGYLLDLRKRGVALQYLDFGGGLGVRYTNEHTSSRQAYTKMIAEVVGPLGVHLLLEPGRSIIAPAGVLLSRVIYSKRNAGKSFVIIDAAMNDLMRPVLYDAPHPITRVVELKSQRKRRSPSAQRRVDVVGQVCETGDSFLQDWPLGETVPGDVLAIWAAGAYGMAQTSNYNGRCRPPEILVEGKRARLIRRRETRSDLVRTDVLA